MPKGKFDRTTDLGRGVINDFVNWRTSNECFKPYPPIGNKDHYGFYEKRYKVVTLTAFSDACKKLIPYAMEKMVQEDFDAFLETLNPDDEYDVKYKAYCLKARQGKTHDVPPSRDDKKKKKKKMKTKSSKSVRSSVSNSGNTNSSRSDDPTFKSADFLDSESSDDGSSCFDEEISDDEANEMAYQSPTAIANVTLDSAASSNLRSSENRSDNMEVALPDSAAAHPQRVKAKSYAKDSDLNVDFSMLEVTSGASNSLRDPMLLKHFEGDSCLVRFELCGDILVNESHKFEFKDGGRRLVYLSKVPKHKVDAAAMLEVKPDKNYSHYMIIKDALEKHLESLKGLEKSQDECYWEQKCSIVLPFQSDQLFYDKEGGKVDMPFISKGENGYFMALVWLKKKPIASPLKAVERKGCIRMSEKFLRSIKSGNGLSIPSVASQPAQHVLDLSNDDDNGSAFASEYTEVTFLSAEHIDEQSIPAIVHTSGSTTATRCDESAQGAGIHPDQKNELERKIELLQASQKQSDAKIVELREKWKASDELYKNELSRADKYKSASHELKEVAENAKSEALKASQAAEKLRKELQSLKLQQSEDQLRHEEELLQAEARGANMNAEHDQQKCQQIELLEENLNEIEKDLAQQRQENRKLKRQLEDANDDLKDVKEKLESAESVNKQATDEVLSYRSQLDEKNSAYDKLQADLIGKNKEVAKQRRENRLL